MKASTKSQQWQVYKDKFAQFSAREQVLIALTGMVAIIFTVYFYVAAPIYMQVDNLQRQNHQVINETKSIRHTITELQNALTKHPDEVLKIQIAQKQRKLAAIDKSLLALTSSLVNPLEMRLALEQLLRMQKGVKLISFEVQSAQPLITAKLDTANQVINKDKAKKNQQIKVSNNLLLETGVADTHLYRHTIKLTLKGSYFQLRDYLAQLETLPWKFFWEKFNYKLVKYPKSELTIEIYSLSLKQEFIGV